MVEGINLPSNVSPSSSNEISKSEPLKQETKISNIVRETKSIIEESRNPSVQKLTFLTKVKMFCGIEVLIPNNKEKEITNKCINLLKSMNRELGHANKIEKRQIFEQYETLRRELKNKFLFEPVKDTDAYKAVNAADLIDILKGGGLWRK